MVIFKLANPLPSPAMSKPLDAMSPHERAVFMMEQFKKSKKQWQRPSASFTSSSPRIPPPKKPACTAELDKSGDKVGSDYVMLDKPAPKALKSGWGACTSAQRPTFRATTDAYYNPKHLEDVRYFYRKAVPSGTPRISETKDNGVPPVGTYTSQYISCGMMD